MPMEKVGCEGLHRLDKEEARALGAVLGLAPVSEDRFWLLPSRLHLARNLAALEPGWDFGIPVHVPSRLFLR